MHLLPKKCSTNLFSGNSNDVLFFKIICMKFFWGGHALMHFNLSLSWEANKGKDQMCSLLKAQNW